MQYELGAIKRRSEVEVLSLRQRIADLELQVVEARKEADEYYKASIERNTEATALANQVLSRSGKYLIYTILSILVFSLEYSNFIYLFYAFFF